MKKLLTIATIGTIFAAPAVAVQKCVAFDINKGASDYTPNSDFAFGDSEVFLTDNETGMQIRLLGMCSPQTNGAMGDAADKIDASYTTSNAKSCWCRMVTPAVSKWVFNYLDTDGGCYSRCTMNCMLYFFQYQNLKQAIFQNILN